MKAISVNNYTAQDIWTSRMTNFQSFLSNRLIVPVSDAIHMLELDKILYLSAESNYCRIIMNDQKFILSSKTLKHFESALINQGFLRVHSSYLINLNRMTGICREEGYNICLDNGSKIPISRAFKNQLFTSEHIFCKIKSTKPFHTKNKTTS